MTDWHAVSQWVALGLLIGVVLVTAEYVIFGLTLEAQLSDQANVWKRQCNECFRGIGQACTWLNRSECKPMAEVNCSLCYVWDTVGRFKAMQP